MPAWPFSPRSTPSARDGTAKYVEVAQVDAAIVWNFQKLTPMANGESFDDSGIRDSVRYQYYETADGNYVVFNALEDKFWLRFCEEVATPGPLRGRTHTSGHTSRPRSRKLRAELADIFRARTRSEWTQFFIDTNIAGAPAFLDGDLFDDPHVKARGPGLRAVFVGGRHTHAEYLHQDGWWLWSSS